MAKVTHVQHSKPLDGLPHEDSVDCPCGPLTAQEDSCLHVRHQTRWPDGEHHQNAHAQAHLKQLAKAEARAKRRRKR